MSIRSTWWHRLVRILQILIVLFLAWSVCSDFLRWIDRPEGKAIYYLQNEANYATKVLETKSFPCFDERGGMNSLPEKITFECERLKSEFLDNSELTSYFFQNPEDKNDLSLVRSVLVKASELQKKCISTADSYKRFVAQRDGLPVPPPQKSYYALTDGREMCNWYFSLSTDRKSFLDTFGTVIAKYESVTIKNIPQFHVLIIVLLVVCIGVGIVLEVLYRVVLFVAFGHRAFRFKLE